MAKTLYKDYFHIDENYFPCVNESAINGATTTGAEDGSKGKKVALVINQGKGMGHRGALTP